MNLLYEKLKAAGIARLQGGGGGGGGGGDPGTGDPGVAEGNGVPASGSVSSGIGGQGNPVGMGLGLMGFPGLGMTATLGNAINGMTGFSGTTPSADPSAPGGQQQYFTSGTMSPTGWVPAPSTLPTVPGAGGASAGGPAGFNAQAYLAANPDVAADPYYGQHPYEHFIQHGQAEGRSPTGLPAAAPTDPNSTQSQSDALRAAQLGLINQQRDIATEMLRRQNLLEPSLLAQQGYEQILDPNTGQVTGYRPTQAFQQQQDANNQINDLMRTRTLAALKGDLPVDPALEKQIEQSRATLGDTLRSNLGAGYETSTPGIQALAEFDRNAAGLRYGAQRDQLTTGEGIQLQQQQVQNQINQARFGSVVGASQLPASAASALASAGTGYTPIGQNLLGQQNLSLQQLLGNLQSQTQLGVAQIGANSASNVAGMQENAANSAGWGQLVGSLGSAFLGSNAGSTWLSGLFG